MVVTMLAVPVRTTTGVLPMSSLDGIDVLFPGLFSYEIRDAKAQWSAHRGPPQVVDVPATGKSGRALKCALTLGQALDNFNGFYFYLSYPCRSLLSLSDNLLPSWLSHARK